MVKALKMDNKETIIGLLRLGWSNRAINKGTNIHRETIKRYRTEFQGVPKVPAESNPTKAQSVPNVACFGETSLFSRKKITNVDTYPVSF